MLYLREHIILLYFCVGEERRKAKEDAAKAAHEKLKAKKKKRREAKAAAAKANANGAGGGGDATTVGEAQADEGVYSK